jgi:hypothetical protein
MWTFSRTDQITACLGSDILPHTDCEHPAREHGSAVHAFLASVVEVGRDEALLSVPAEYREVCEAFEVDRLPLAGMAAEVAFAYDVATDTARELGRNIGRAYPADLKPTEIPGSLDLLGLHEDGESVVVLDHKTGRGRVRGPAKNGQLRLGALAACRAYGRSRAVVGIVHIPEGPAPWTEWAEIDAMDLDSWAVEVQQTFERLTAERALYAERQQLPTITEGPHCEHCPAFNFCPAKARLAAHMALAPNVLDVDVSELSDEQAGRALERLWAVQQVADRVEKALKERARSRPVPLSNGNVYAQVETRREALDAGAVFAVLSEQHGATVAQAACEMKTSKAAIEETLGEVARAKKAAGEKTTKRSLVVAALDAVRARGGSREVTRVELREITPKALEPAPETKLLSGPTPSVPSEAA